MLWNFPSASWTQLWTIWRIPFRPFQAQLLDYEKSPLFHLVLISYCLFLASIKYGIHADHIRANIPCNKAFHAFIYCQFLYTYSTHGLSKAKGCLLLSLKILFHLIVHIVTAVDLKIYTLLWPNFRQNLSFAKFHCRLCILLQWHTIACFYADKCSLY